MIIDEETLAPQKFGWFGGKSGEALPDLGDAIAKHTKGDSQGNKAERYAIREVKKSSFEWDDNIEQIFDRLFGK